MTLDDLELLYNLEFSRNVGISQIWEATGDNSARRTKIRIVTVSGSVVTH